MLGQGKEKGLSHKPLRMWTHLWCIALRAEPNFFSFQLPGKKVKIIGFWSDQKKEKKKVCQKHHKKSCVWHYSFSKKKKEKEKKKAKHCKLFFFFAKVSDINFLFIYLLFIYLLIYFALKIRKKVTRIHL